MIQKLFAYLAVSVLGGTAAALPYVPAAASTLATKLATSKRIQSGIGRLPQLPRGRRTVLGGRIYDVDPVNDQFELKIPGGKSVPVSYDVRTHFFQDGVERSVLDLHSASHASVETTLNGEKIFAVSVHLLSKAPEGEINGQVITYRAATGMLTMRSNITNSAIALQVPQQMNIVATGQIKSPSAGGELVPGALVKVKFWPGSHGHGVATRIDLLAYPGARFIFQGKISYININSGRLVLQDAVDQKTYHIAFTSQQLSKAENLHIGSNVKAVAVFNGTTYVAQSISTW
jgi:hypothetical protein